MKKGRKLLYPRVIELLTQTRDPDKAALGRRLAPLMEKAERFVFESYGDADPEVFKAVHFTAEEMIDAGFFHLPYPILWFEDPWNYDDMLAKQLDSMRALFGELLPSRDAFDTWGANSYLCIEERDRIWVWGVTSSPEPRIGHQFLFHGVPTEIDLRADRPANLDWQKQLGGPLHAVKQLIVTLATKQAEVTDIAGKPWKPKCPLKLREYGFKTVQIKVAGQTQAEAHAATGRRRKLELVRGYMYGKNTRPREHQRWVAPYWRGDESLGVTMRDHYEVKG